MLHYPIKEFCSRTFARGAEQEGSCTWTSTGPQADTALGHILDERSARNGPNCPAQTCLHFLLRPGHTAAPVRQLACWHPQGFHRASSLQQLSCHRVRPVLFLKGSSKVVGGIYWETFQDWLQAKSPAAKACAPVSHGESPKAIPPFSYW